MEQRESPLAVGISILVGIVFFVIIPLSSCGSPSALSNKPPSTEVLQDPTQASLSTPSPSTRPTVHPSPTATSTSSPTATPTPIGGSGVLLFDSWEVFTFDISTHALARIADGGFTLEAVSPNGHRVLFAHDELLITANPDGSGQMTVAKNFSGERGVIRALWIPETERILFVGRDQGQDSIYSVREDGSDMRRIIKQGSGIIKIYETNSSSIISWEKGFIATAGVFYEGAWRANVDGSNQELLENIIDPVYSPNGDRLAAKKINNVAGIHQMAVFIMGSDLSGEVQLTIPLEVWHYFIDSYYWIEGGKRLLVQVLVCDPVCDEPHHYVYSELGSLDREIKIPDIMWRGSVSPDGLQLAYRTSQRDDKGSNNRLIDLNTFIITTLEPQGFVMWLR